MRKFDKYFQTKL